MNGFSAQDATAGRRLTGRTGTDGNAARGYLTKGALVEHDLRHALRRGELAVHYQPIVSLADGMPVGCEALVRWQHPTRGLVPPGEFIPIAEERGLIGEVGRLVLLAACRQAREWRRAGKRIYVAVNVAPVQLLQDGIVEAVGDALRETGLPPHLLSVEVTESSLAADVARLVPALEALKALDVRVAVDDFGSGSSSFSYLSALPVDMIKLDRRFVAGMSDRREDRAIVAAVLSLARELDLAVIAEGVETEPQHRELRALGCGFAQGFLYARPQPASRLSLDGYSAAVQPGVGDPSVVREFMRRIGIKLSGARG